MFISPSNEMLSYTGRIDFTDKEAPVFVYPSTSVEMNFKGEKLSVSVENFHHDEENYLGYIVDGKQGRIKLSNEAGRKSYEILLDQSVEEHQLMLFKRQDACHYLAFLGFELDDNGELTTKPKRFLRKIEVYGDSVSAGSVSEAVDYVGKSDPEHNGEYSNSYFSYAWMTARKLHAQIHNISQGGVALLDGTGYFGEPDYIGMEKIYDKVQYNPALGEIREWDFSEYRPQVVIIAIGQNDSNPEDYMRNDPTGEKARNWIARYEAFVRTIRGKYPDASIVLCTTILNHSPAWDRAIGLANANIRDSKIYHFLYKNNGRGTPGHIRVSEAEDMSFELASFVLAMGEDIWDN